MFSLRSALLAIALLPVVARAHTELRASDPARDSRLTRAPQRVTLWFTERPELAFCRVAVTGPSGAVALGSLAADTGNGVRVDFRQSLAPGQYVVEWQAASSDGHVTRGQFSFAVAPTGAAPPAVPSVVPPHTAPPAAIPADAEHRTVRWIEFVALLTVIGAFGFRHGVLPPLAVRGVATADAADRARRLGQSALVLYLVAALVRAYEQSVVVHGAARALVASDLIPMLTTTVWGIGWSLGVIGALLVVIGWWLGRRGIPFGSPLAIVGVIGMIVSPGLSGHAAAGRFAPMALGLDAAHVAAAGVWLGGLFHVTFAGIPATKRLGAERDGAIATLVNSFHPIALFCAPVVVVAGLGTAWLRLGTVDALWTTEYGVNLIWKLVLFVGVAAIGATNWLRVRPRLGATMSVRHIRVTATIELVLATLVLAVTAALVLSPVPSMMVGR